MSLADTQRRLREAVVDGGRAELALRLVGGREPLARLAIHGRHYKSSLVSALLSRFSATQWLIGTPPLIGAAEDFVRHRPPTAPCIAEYGAAFPDWLAELGIAKRVPFLREFATLDWQLGRISTEVERGPLTPEALHGLAPEAIGDLTVRFQPGVHYLSSTWPIDHVMRLFVTETEPSHEPMAPADVWLEVRGARGSFRFLRLDAGEFEFRSALHGGATLAIAAARAMDLDERFDPGRGLAALFSAGLAVAASPAHGDRDA
ncbi:MAG: DNA-binding domain-containing protein [Acidobacteria bacterium]|nr:DNA-binding domain-containing protein [Acidobacteriota bacterium]